MRVPREDVKQTIRLQLTSFGNVMRDVNHESFCLHSSLSASSSFLVHLASCGISRRTGSYGYFVKTWNNSAAIDAIFLVYLFPAKIAW